MPADRYFVSPWNLKISILHIACIFYRTFCLFIWKYFISIFWNMFLLWIACYVGIAFRSLRFSRHSVIFQLTFSAAKCQLIITIIIVIIFIIILLYVKSHFPFLLLRFFFLFLSFLLKYKSCLASVYFDCIVASHGYFFPRHFHCYYLDIQSCIMDCAITW